MAKKILIVEDELKLASVLSAKLEKMDFEVLTAGNGEEGLRKVANDKPDLILLDIVMPVMDGLTMLKKLREANDKTPVIVLSNLSDSDNVAESFEQKSYDYLVKTDYSLDDVINKINHALS